MATDTDSVSLHSLLRNRHTDNYATPSTGQQLPKDVPKNSSIFLRTLGLGLVSALAQVRDKHEHPKVALRQSRSIALLRATIHLLPIATSILLTSLNLQTFYVGAHANWTPALQFVAKGLEMLMQASIATVAFAYLRHELASCDHLPFGALFSALQVRDLSYLWSLEFWGSASARCFRGRHQYVFLIFVPFTVLLAAGVGPSSAIALIPRQTNYPAGTVPILLNYTDQQIYPQSIDSNQVYSYCDEANADVYHGWSCPSSDWLSMDDLSALQVQLTSSSSIRQLSVCSYGGNCHNDTISTTQVAQVADGLAIGANAWANHLSQSTGTFGKFKSRSNVIHSAQVKQPYVAASCIANHIYPDDTRNISFSKSQSWSSMFDEARQQGYSELLDGQHFTYQSDIPRADILERAEEMGGDFYVNYTRLPTSMFPNTTIGAIIVFGFNADLPYLQTAACLISASWGDATINTTANTNTTTRLMVQSSTFEPPWDNMQSWPLDRIQVSEGWAEMLMPPLIGGSGTVIGNLGPAFSIPTQIGGEQWMPNIQQFEDSAWPNGPDVPLIYRRSYAYEVMMASVFALATARTGIISNDQTAFHPLVVSSDSSITSLLPQNHYTILMQVEVEGLAYSTEGVPIKLAITIILIYCLFALSHVCYAAMYGLSLTSWDSIPELTVLAMQSAPTEFLSHTTAGVDTLETFRRPVKLRALDDDHLEIVFAEDKTGRSLYEVKKNVAY